MECGEIVVEKIFDIFYSVDDFVVVFEVFFGLEICKLVFQFDG